MLRDKLFRGEDIYAGFVLDETRVDLQGWGSDHPILPWCIGKLRPTLIIEVGSWKGRSAINMARTAKELQLNLEILCIDTWLGSAEHWLAAGEAQVWRDSLLLKHGYPNLYETFLTNVVANDCQALITPLPVPSETAFHILTALGTKAEMIYIDAGHEYESVLRDIQMYWQFLADDGVMILDDYLAWPGVTKAVSEFSLANGLTVFGENGKAALTRNGHLFAPNFVSATFSPGSGWRRAPS